MLTRTLATAALLATAVGLGGCGGEPDIAACKAAMKEQYTTATEKPDSPAATRPEACEGVDDETLQRLAGEIIAESLEG